MDTPPAVPLAAGVQGQQPGGHGPPACPPPLLPLQFLLQQACKGNSLVVTAPVLPGSPPLLGLYLAFDTILPAELLKSIGLEVDHMLQVSKP